MKQPKKSKGLGDSVEKITKATGIKKIVHFIKGEDCNCDARRLKLNRKLPFFKNLECLTKKEYDYLTKYFETKSERPSDKQFVIDIYNRIFGDKLTVHSCTQCFPDVLINLTHVYETYNDNNI
jgi:hypothetical protein